jgi:hypothetical protein
VVEQANDEGIVAALVEGRLRLEGGLIPLRVALHEPCSVWHLETERDTIERRLERARDSV